MRFNKILSIILFILPLGYGNPIAGGKNVRNILQSNVARFNVAEQNKYPFIVHLTIIEESNEVMNSLQVSIYECGGVIITERIILTAAHCLEESIVEPNVIIRAGLDHLEDCQSDDIQESHMEAYSIHKDYTADCELSENLMDFCSNDIAMIWLKTPFVFNQNVQKAILPEPGESLSNKNGIIIGWGENAYGHKMNLLQEAEMGVIPKRNCEKLYNDTVINDKMICLLSINKTAGSCEGDSGSPFIINGKVYGIASFSSSIIDLPNLTLPTKTCETSLPSVYTNVGNYKNWIKKRLLQGPKKVKNTRSCKEFKGCTTL